MNTYLIQICGQIDLNELNPMSPHQMVWVRSEPESTLVSICTDQSGLIGLLRHLHSLGLVFLSIVCQVEESSALSERKAR